MDNVRFGPVTGCDEDPRPALGPSALGQHFALPELTMDSRHSAGVPTWAPPTIGLPFLSLQEGTQRAHNRNKSGPNVAAMRTWPRQAYDVCVLENANESLISLLNNPHP
jgi:hypothetical protein